MKSQPQPFRQSVWTMDHTRRGVILLMVLAALTILTTLTAAMAWTVSTRCLGVDARVSRQQNHFAMNGAVAVINHKLQAGELKHQVEANGVGAGALHLGSVAIYYKVWDENTKYKVVPGSSNVLPDFLTQSNFRLRVSPAKGTSAGAVLFEDVFDIKIDELADIYGPVKKGKALADVATLWSDGRINANTAGEQVLRRALEALDQAAFERLLQFRRDRHISDLGQLVQWLGLNPHEAQILKVRLTTGMQRVGIRLICQGPTLRSDAFTVVDVGPSTPLIRLWCDLPALGSIDELMDMTEI